MSPAAVLEGHRQGELHVVYPTLRNLEALTGFDRAADVLAAFEERPCPT
jgi:hypothetical protein